MYVSSKDVENAVLMIYSDLRIPVGGKLSHAMLVKEWPRTHLRHSDLMRGLQRLARVRWLELEDTPEGQCAVLTQAGYSHIQSMSSARMVSLMRRVRLLFAPMARVFERAEKVRPRRRLADRVAPQI